MRRKFKKVNEVKDVRPDYSNDKPIHNPVITNAQASVIFTKLNRHFLNRKVGG